ncbi:hypothetical protein BU23DRAFT_553864 [Bimuria novae-zelandiae CBS 107.79]|uniref:Velvet domain-containing protein n=1 Tax=Bimuria novae-zelandiae CBS 107.79 TaxID=1447943 RepID=A0A6A5V9S0_9PLEO|nr:hypothetical protein BU23DRAFT_553864 [Bimuria novae-zelandiae CBS 107.79]
MQRGRGRGQGRNPNPSRGTSRSGGRSTSRITTSRARRTTSVRRSARLAELLNNELHGGAESSTSNSMAHVAQQRAISRSSARSRHETGNRRASRPNRTPLTPEDRGYAMDIVVQPPSNACAGYSINGTIIVRLRTTNPNPNAATEDALNLAAIASLVPGPGSTVSTDPAVLNTLLSGRRVENIHTLADDEADGSIASMELGDAQAVGYMRFSGLTIRQVGTYRIRITLLRMRNSSSDPPVASVTGAAAVQVVDSNPIVVQAGVPTAYNGKYLVAKY